VSKIRAAFQEVPFRTRRIVEWMIVASVILLLVLVFGRQTRLLQGQAELANLKTTLGALRTALVLDHLHKVVAKDTAALALPQHNPFELLQRYPVNYIGEMSPQQAAVAPGGTWVYDPACVCVGYLPIWGEWLDSPNGDVMLWYRVTGASGPLQLTAKEAYRWQGQVLN
jgi:hypothetical protein